jgi:hypothetical protein
MKLEYPSLFHSRKSVQVWVCDEPCCEGKRLHRDDGPAVIYPDGTTEWWRHGRRLMDVEVAGLQGELAAKAMGRLSRPVAAPERAAFPKKSRL